MLHLYSHPMSPYGQKVQFFLEETGRPYQFHQLESAKGDLNAPAFRKVSPFGLMPGIELDGFGLSESGAILRYLAQKWQLHQLYPQNLEDRAKIDMIMDYSTLHVGRHISALAWQLTWTKALNLPANPQAISEAQTALAKHLPRLENFAAERGSFLAGPQLTLADISLMPFVAQAPQGQVSLRDFPALSAWVQRVGARPAWKKVAAR